MAKSLACQESTEDGCESGSGRGYADQVGECSGYEIAAGLGALGWSVGIGARDKQRLEDAVAKLRADGIDPFGGLFDDAGTVPW